MPLKFPDSKIDAIMMISYMVSVHCCLYSMLANGG